MGLPPDAFSSEGVAAPGETAAPRLSADAAGLVILEEDEGLLAVNKPSGLVCHPTKGDAWSSLIGRLRLFRPTGPVHLINRLDRETSGVVLVAKDPATAGKLGALFESRAVTKRYLAIVHGHPRRETFTVAAPLGRDEASPVAIKDTVRPDGAPAETAFQVVRRWVRQDRPFSLVRALPVTGRKHQIRIHLAHAGHPVVGDKIYGGDPGRYLRFVAGQSTDADRLDLWLPCHALHAASLSFPWDGTLREIRAEAETGFLDFCAG